MLFGKRIKELRESQKLPQRVVADALEINIPLYSRVERGERTLSKSHLPKLAQVLNVEENELLKLYLADQVALVLDGQTEIYDDVLDIAKNGIKKMSKKSKFTFIDLFAGIGGFHYALHSTGGECVFASEWDKNARISYENNFKNISPALFQKDSDGNYIYFNGDINEADPTTIPDFDILCGGFPCQPFSIAGLRKGFEDARGTLFYEFARVIKECEPKVFLFENVKGMINHDGGKTWRVKRFLWKS